MKTDSAVFYSIGCAPSFPLKSGKQVAEPDEQKESVDPIWDAIRREARAEEQACSCLCLFLNKSVLEATSLEEALGGILSSKLATGTVTEDRMQSLILPTSRCECHRSLAREPFLAA